MDEFGRRVASGLKPEPADVTAEGWAKLVGCLILDLAGDASELIPGLGELTDVVCARRGGAPPFYLPRTRSPRSASRWLALHGHHPTFRLVVVPRQLVADYRFSQAIGSGLRRRTRCPAGRGGAHGGREGEGFPCRRRRTARSRPRRAASPAR